MMLTDKERQILACAADHIEKVGWMQGNMFKKVLEVQTAPCCMLGAIRVCQSPNKPYTWWQANEAACLAEKMQYPAGSRTKGWRYNDVKGRTKEQIINVLRANARGERP